MGKLTLSTQRRHWMENPKCMLCGRPYPTGLNILGCFLCFECEKRLLRPGAAHRLAPMKRRRLAQWAKPESMFVSLPRA